MSTPLTIRQFTSFAIPLILIGLVVFISKSRLFYINPDTISIGITTDLLVTIPVIHFLLLRKTTTSKITIPVFIFIGVTVGSIILPVENQEWLHFAKVWFLPIIELAILFIVVRNVRTTIHEAKQNQESFVDVFGLLKNICSKLLPQSAAVFLASELAVIYYGFIKWKRFVPKRNEFTYHRNSGTIGLLITVIFLVIAETFTTHLLLAQWSLLGAWGLTALSIYAVIQLLGFLKSIARRPMTITPRQLHLSYGILSETKISIQNIESVSITSQTIEFNNTTRSLSPFEKLEGHNLVIRVKEEGIINGLYGINRKFTAIALLIDDPEKFVQQIQENSSIIFKHA